MTEENRDNHSDQAADPAPVRDEWGQQPDDNFGYASDEERRANRGLEDWEMVEQMSQSEGDLFAWLRTTVGAIVLGVVAFIAVAYGVYYFLVHYGFHFFTKG
ncbi:MAG TPA: hypothetical protein VNM68_06495 [Candidatus Polarisedimenticolia bacterium]|nr:hypothetical protein [Candidatus Polarisedimenticolia bacterium]